MSPSPADDAVPIEPRWPVAAAILCFTAITLAVRIGQPHRETIGPRWLVPTLEVLLLAALVAADPLHAGRRRWWLRPVSITIVLLLAVVALVSTEVLIVDLVQGGKATEDASWLLASGALIWFGNALVFSLVYWLLDAGGPLARYRHEREHGDFAFTQQMDPGLAPSGWLPHYVDYLILGLTTSTAFSPTDVLPLTHWAKLTMVLQSLISLAVVGLVIARAVNVFR